MFVHDLGGADFSHWHTRKVEGSSVNLRFSILVLVQSIPHLWDRGAREISCGFGDTLHLKHKAPKHVFALSLCS